MVPLYGFLKGDVMGLVVLAHEEHTVAKVAGLLATAAGVRVPVGAFPVVRANGAVLDLEATVASARLSALDRIDVEYQA
jgi:hypothetical protein